MVKSIRFAEKNSVGTTDINDGF